MSKESDEAAFLQPGQLVDHFKVMRLLGKGGMGAVYLARDTKLGRKVALKMILPKALGDDESLDRFFFEARVTARFSHPHIVTIFAVGEYNGGPYLALEFLEGQTLRERAQEEKPSHRETLRFGIAIAEALVEAHKHKLLHRDLKPENVIIPRDGRLRVLDFGLAKAMPAPGRGDEEDRATMAPGGVVEGFETEGDIVVGTPSYMAPEQWAAAPCTGAADVWALGVILFELLAGRLPFMAKSMMELFSQVCVDDPPMLEDIAPVPAPLSDLIVRCLNKNPDDRPSAESVVTELGQLLFRERPRLTGEVSPFRGLLPFSERHSELFFGRDAEVGAFVERLREQPVLPVVGPSGAGKSSFVQAGVIPRLREQGEWLVLQLRPGSRPFKALSQRVARGESSGSSGSDVSAVFAETEHSTPATSPNVAFDMPSVRTEVSSVGDDTLGPRIYDNPALLPLLLQRLAERTSSKVLLFVDQLEEVYALVPDLEVRRRFMEAVCRAADDPQGPVRVIFTLRDDFLGRVAETATAREALGHITVLRSPGAEALEEILTRPLEAVGYAYEDEDLPKEMVASVAGEPASLPLLQFACRRLWYQRDQDKNQLTRKAYVAMGGVEGALAHQADDLLEGLLPDQVLVARQIFLRLITPDGTRQVMTRSKLLEGLGDEAPEVLQKLTQGRAIVVRRGRRKEGDAELELVHESLITRWERLARWVEESRDEVVFLAEISQAAELWEKRGWADEEVWHGLALQEALARAARCAVLPEHVQRFLDAGQKREAARARGKRLVLVGVIGALVLVALILLGMVYSARREQDEADRQRISAESRRVAIQRIQARAALKAGNPVRGRALLREALEAEDSLEGRALWWQLEAEPLILQHRIKAVLQSMDFSPDGTTVAADLDHRAIGLVDVGSLATRVLQSDRYIVSVAFSPDGALLASGGAKGEVRIQDNDRGRTTVLKGHTDAVYGLGFSGDGSLLATGSEDRTVRVWQTASGKLLRTIEGHRGGVRAVTFDPSGALLATGGLDADVRLWQAQTGVLQKTLTGHSRDITGLSFANEGASLFSGSRDSTVRVWNVGAGTEKMVLRAGGQVTDVEVSPAGDIVVASSFEGGLKLWDTKSGATRATLRGREPISGIAFRSDGKVLASASHRGEIRLWHVDKALAQSLPGGHAKAVSALAFDPMEQALLSGGQSGDVRLWDLRSGLEVLRLHGHSEEVEAAAFDPSGRLIATGGGDHTVRIWEGGRTVMTLLGHTDAIQSVAFLTGLERKYIVSASQDRTVRLWDLETGDEHRVLRGHSDTITGMCLLKGQDQDERDERWHLATASHDKTIRLWDVRTGEHKTLLSGLGPIAHLACSPEGDMLAAVTHEKLILADSSGQVTQAFKQKRGNRAQAVRFHPKGQHLGVVDENGQGRLVTLATMDTVSHYELPAWDRGRALAFGPSGRVLSIGSESGTVRLFDTEQGTALWRGALVDGPWPSIRSHLGWTTESQVGARFRTAVEQADRVSSSHRAKVGCVLSTEGQVELWDLGADTRLRSADGTSASSIHAFDGGCLTLSRGRLSMLEKDGASKVLETGVSAVTARGDKILVAKGSATTLWAGGSTKGRALPGVKNASAVAFIKSHLALGTEQGQITLFPFASKGRRGRITLKKTPNSRVSSLLIRPGGMVVAGFANGRVGLWSAVRGTMLHRTRLNGPVTHLWASGDDLVVASELGQTTAMDLSVFSQDYCALIRQVWDAVPAVWEDGRLVLRRPPADHECTINGE